MNALVALDPSIRAAGLALFVDGRLKQAVAINSSSSGTPAQKAAAIGRLLVDQIERWLGMSMCGAELATEWPQVYRATKSPGDPNDLIGMAGVVGYVIGAAAPRAARAFLPGEWCKLPKSRSHKEAFTSVRGLRIMSRLDELERSAVPRSHDAVDAVGIGLHALERLQRGRLFAGAV